MTKAELVNLFKFYNPDIPVGTGATKKITEAELLIILNNGALDIARLTKCVSGIRSMSAVQYQFKYTLNSNVLFIDDEGGIWYWESTTGSELDRVTIDYWDENYFDWHAGTPNRAMEYVRRGKEIWLRPNPDIAAYTTTLNGAITSSASTMTLTSGTYFPKRFRCLIDSEVIECQYHSSGNCYSLVRGVEDTTAASHADGATVTIRNLLLATIEKPVKMENNTDDPFNGLTHLEPYHEGILKYAQWKTKPIINLKWDAAKGETEYLEFVKKMKEELKSMPDLRHEKLRIWSYIGHYETAF